MASGTIWKLASRDLAEDALLDGGRVDAAVLGRRGRHRSVVPHPGVRYGDLQLVAVLDVLDDAIGEAHDAIASVKSNRRLGQDTRIASEGTAGPAA